MLPVVGSILQGVAFITSVVCFILVLVKMFQKGNTGLGIACIILTVCCFIGPVITFVYGWIKSGDWNLRNIMVAWTVAIILGFIGAALNPQQFQQIQQYQQQTLPNTP